MIKLIRSEIWGADQVDWYECLRCGEKFYKYPKGCHPLQPIKCPTCEERARERKHQIIRILLMLSVGLLMIGGFILYGRLC